MAWIIYILVVLVVSILIGLHLGRFRIAYTEMSGMMLGMTMGMLNGFLIGYAAAAVSSSMFWGNLFGILLGLGLGVYYGRSGGLMGIMDGGMGGVMGGSMGAMLAIMVAFPHWAQGWTAVLLSTLYVLGMAGLVALIEQSAPDHAAFHRLLPMFARAIAVEAAEEAKQDCKGLGPPNRGLLCIAGCGGRRRRRRHIRELFRDDRRRGRSRRTPVREGALCAQRSAKAAIV